MDTKSLKRIAQWKDTLPHFLERVSHPNGVGCYRLAPSGLTSLGEQTLLGVSTFALKCAYTLGLWDELSEADQEAWGAYLRSYQITGRYRALPYTENAFIDALIVAPLTPTLTWRGRLRRLIRWSLSYQQLVIRAETKQAIASLMGVGQHVERPFDGFMLDVPSQQRFFRSLDWRNPWHAGSHYAHELTFIQTMGASILSTTARQSLLESAERFICRMADTQTGAYFTGVMPHYDQLINGSMKVLAGLDWSQQAIHYPQRLIDTCLQQKPRSDGCHLVDNVYVLYRCSQQTTHRRRDIQAYVLEILVMIAAHYRPADGGFSYFVDGSQTTYYTLPITHRQPLADLHGTMLLTWALAMIFVLLEDSRLPEWRVIKP